MQAPQEIQPVPFGSYQLLERLAMGGMAEVFLARPDGQDRLVALKRILPSIAADDEFIAMFIDEAKIAGQLTHANVAQIIDIGKISGSYFIAMEYVSGHDLRAVWDRTRDQATDSGDSIRGLPIGVACHIVKKLSEGLDFAHRRRDAKGRPLGIIHRDVSPQNILISYEGDLKIIDFGIAKAANRIVKTQTGILKGKFAYMAPEQARGEPIDHRSDIFAIGVVLYELLTGERAFKGDTDFALLEKVRRVDVVPPKTLRPDLPKELERIVMKALGKEAGDRYAWASVLASDLDRFLSDQGISTSREELGAFLRRTFREEHAEEIRRLALYKRQAGGSSSTRQRGRIDGSSATVVRGGSAAKNGVRPSLGPAPSSSDSDSDTATAIGDPIDDPLATAFLDDPRPANEVVIREPAVKMARPVQVEVLATPAQPAAVQSALESMASRPVPSSPSPSSPSSPSSSPSSPSPSSPSPSPSAAAPSQSQPRPRRQPLAVVSASAPVIERELPPPFEPTGLPRDARELRGSNNGVIVVACLLGALLGAALGVGLSLATREVAFDTLVVTVPRQAEVLRGDAVLCTQTPCALQLGKGRHELLLRAPGAEAVTRVVEVGESWTTLDVVLQRTARAIRIETEPSGATVLLDDVELPEVTPTTLPPLVVGKAVQLVLSRDGYEALSALRTIEGDAVWRFALPTPLTTYTLTSMPADALLTSGTKDGAGRLVVVSGKRPLAVKVTRPGCASQDLNLVGTGKSTASRTITLDCRDFAGRISIQAPRRPAAVKIDGITLPKGVDLSAYPLPVGTWNVVLTSSHGKRDSQTVEVVRGVNTPVVSRIK